MFVENLVGITFPSKRICCYKLVACERNFYEHILHWKKCPVSNGRNSHNRNCLRLRMTKSLRVFDIQMFCIWKHVRPSLEFAVVKKKKKKLLKCSLQDSRRVSREQVVVQIAGIIVHYCLFVNCLQLAWPLQPSWNHGWWWLIFAGAILHFIHLTLCVTGYVNRISTQFIQVLINGMQSLHFMHYVF